MPQFDTGHCRQGGDDRGQDSQSAAVGRRADQGGAAERGYRCRTQSPDRSVRLWDVRTGTESRRFLGHARRVNAVAFAPTRDCLASASDDGTVMIWNAGITRRDKCEGR